ncbi:MAG: hypothetical protein COB14_01345 [Alphaproteobacteria bacterium]|nr:MAG: hypothetical protein COB14_01345 [Alphaproteobacteria bacterium]
MKRILIIGGYGDFGSFITKKLAQESNIQVIIAGRSLGKANRLVAELDAVNKAEAKLDINNGFAEALAEIKPDIVIHTSGPFQMQGYPTAQKWLDQKTIAYDVDTKAYDLFCYYFLKALVFMLDNDLKDYRGMMWLHYSGHHTNKGSHPP